MAKKTYSNAMKTLVSGLSSQEKAASGQTVMLCDSDGTPAGKVPLSTSAIIDAETGDTLDDTLAGFYERKNNVLIEDEGVFQLKDDILFPVAHPDISTNAAILPQRLGELDVKEVLIAPGNEGNIPSGAKVIEAFSFNDYACVPAVCKKDGEPVKAVIFNKGVRTVEDIVEGDWVISNSENITPIHTLIKYAVKHGQDYGPVTRSIVCLLVDLGLPSGNLWADRNIGAKSATKSGLFHAWGDTQGWTPVGGNSFSWADYIYARESHGDYQMTKYNSSDGKKVLEDGDDAAKHSTSSILHTPTAAEFEELINNTDVERIKDGDLTYAKFTNKTDSTKFIILPVSGIIQEGYHYESVGAYMTSSLGNESVYDSDWFKKAKCLEVEPSSGAGYITKVSTQLRCYGYTIRGVYTPNV